jgi:N-acetylmuramoyl-L-alanine amidase
MPALRVKGCCNSGLNFLILQLIRFRLQFFRLYLSYYLIFQFVNLKSINMKNPFKIVAVLAAAACFAFALPKAGTPKQINVVIDAGHGGKDYGATHEQFSEKEIVDRIANKIKELNKDNEVVIHLTRATDEFVSLEDRVATMNALKPDIVLSLHINAAENEVRSGMELFVYDSAKEHVKSSEYAGRLVDKLEAGNFKVAGVKSAKFYVLNKSEAPTVMFQMGYLSDEHDRDYLTNDKKQEEIAGIVLDFLKELK